MKERRGGDERRFPVVHWAETIEREGQRVMAVRGRSEGLLRTTLLGGASWVVEGVREEASGRQTRAGRGKGFVCGLPYISILAFWILL